MADQAKFTSYYNELEIVPLKWNKVNGPMVSWL